MTEQQERNMAVRGNDVEEIEKLFELYLEEVQG